MNPKGRIRALTSKPFHHFFGYYGISPWSSDRVYHLCLETDFHEHRPRPGDSARVALVHTSDGRVQPIGETAAFNLQQGSMLHWVRSSYGEELTYNVFDAGGLRTRTFNPETGKSRLLDSALAGVNPSGSLGTGLNFARMGKLRPVVGYATDDSAGLDSRPSDDGVFFVDIESGESELAVSLADIHDASDSQGFSVHMPADTTSASRHADGHGRSRRPPAVPPLENQPMWANHTVFSPNGDRVAFLARALTEEKWLSSLVFLDVRTREIEIGIPWGSWISHFVWLNNDTLLVSTDVTGVAGFVELDLMRREIVPTSIQGLPVDGHPTLSPDGNYLVCDTSHHREADGCARLYGLDLLTGKRIQIGSFWAPPWCRGDVRCDLHPRFSPDGSSISFDSVHEGSRQIYLWEG